MTDELLETNSNPKEKFWGLGYDRVFKSVFCDEESVKLNDYHLLERLIKEAVKKQVDVVRILFPELPVSNTLERTKRLDLIAECKNEFVHIELNSKWDEPIRVRNLIFFFCFYTQYSKIGKMFETDKEFINISLNFRMRKNMKLVYDSKSVKDIDLYLLNTRIIYINIDKYKKL